MIFKAQIRLLPFALVVFLMACANTGVLCAQTNFAQRHESVPRDAKPLERFSLTVGPTVLPMNARSGGTVPTALIAGRLNVFTTTRWSAGIAARVIAPLEGTTVAADCVPNVPCPSFQSPDALYGASGELAVSMFGRRLRVSMGAGFLTAQHLSDVTRTNSATIDAGMEYVISPAWRVSPIISVRVQRLTRNVAGLEAIVLPTFGIVF